MSLFTGVRARLRALLRFSATEQELDSEIRFHIEQQTEENLRTGMASEEAARRARIAFGGTESVREEHRDARGTRWLEDAVADARYGFRSLLRNPALAATAIITLALGIGANAAIFSAVNGVILRPLPFAGPDRLVKLSEDNPEKHWVREMAAPANYLDWAEQVRAFAGVAAYTPGGHTTLSGAGEAVMFYNANVTGNFFSVLGIPALEGRTFHDGETWVGGTHVAVISDRLWHTRFGTDPGIVGRTVRFDEVPTEIVGVVPASYAFPNPKVDVWMPMEWKPTDRSQDWFRRAHWLGVVARLKPGATLEGADAEFQGVVRRLQVQYPATNRVMGADLMPLQAFLTSDVRTPLLILLGAVALLLLIACANVGNLLLVQALGRERESALRLTLGAARGRLVRQALTESLLLSACGGLAGCALAWAGTRGLAALQPAGLVRVQGVTVDWRLVLFIFGITTASGLLFGLAPAVWRGRQAPADVLKEGGRGGSEGTRIRRLGNGLVVAEVSLALLLTVGAGLLVKSFWNLGQVNPGFDPTNVLTVGISLPGTRYDSAAKVIGFYDALQDRVRHLPGVAGGAAALVPSLAGVAYTTDYHIGGRPADQYGTEIAHQTVSPDYFRVMRVPLLAGRMFTEADRKGAPLVTIINEALAKREFAGQSPLGQLIADDKIPDSTTKWLTIVGVAGDEHQTDLSTPPQIEMYQPFAQSPNSYMTLVTRTTSDPEAMIPSVRRAIADLDPNVAIATLQTMEQLRSSTLTKQRFITILLLTFAVAGLLLSTVGVYGVVAQLARRRTREMGIRIALGAAAGQVQWLVVNQGLRLVAFGVMLGTVAAFGATRAMRSVLFGVSPTDPVTFVAVPAILAAAALLASWLPAARASRTDPASTLRFE
ncbi:MAG TPA: ABC transporter permease [Gemmatimonadales bacterium]|nr:ABC transporter permease [Gemmatimonadales bacterium]